MNNKLWVMYCKSLGVNPRSVEIQNSDYYQRGFKEWKRLKEEYKYYNYMACNC